MRLDALSRRARGGSDLAQPIVEDSSCNSTQRGQLHVAWFRAKRASLKGVAMSVVCFFMLGSVRPGAWSEAWLGTRVAASVLVGLLARAVDWKLLVLAMYALATTQAAAPHGRELDHWMHMANWPGGYLPDNRDILIAGR